MCGMKDSFGSRVMPKNLYCWVMGISEPFNVRVGWLSILWIWQKYMHLVLLLEISKQFFIVHFNILLMHWCIFLSMVTMFLELEQIKSHRHIMIHWFLGGGKLLFDLFLSWIGSQIGYYTKVHLFLVVLVRRVYYLFVFGRSGLLGSVLWRWGYAL